ncbi:MAG TPA: hypothetical protein VN649_01790 [Ramlibacter sp.]|nr:hypothetical protein [Ramlibacter sp.]
MDASTVVDLALLAVALAAALVMRPWRLLRAGSAHPGLSTPFLAMLTIVAWLWSWPAAAAVPVQWSGAALAVLTLGWPLAVPVLAVAGLSTMATAGLSWAEALSATIWLGLMPATAVLVLGQAVRAALGTHPVVYLLGRAFAVPLVALFVCTLGAAVTGQGLAAQDGEIQVVAAFLLALGETSWTCAIASILVAWRPQWLATWSDVLYLGPRCRPSSG